MLVSIIIPTHRGSKTICRAVDSAFSQDYDHLEVIVVDDNGAGTMEQIETERQIARYLNLDNFKYIAHEHNKNGAAARNTGVRAAKGEFIAFLDDDDEFLPFKIRLQVEALAGKSDDYGACYSSFVNIFPDGRRREIYAEKSGDLCADLLSMEISVLSSVLMVKKSAWEAVGGFDESFLREQDQEFCARVFQKYKVVAVPEITMVRHILKRNAPADVEKSVEYRYKYINKVKEIISTYPKKDQEKIYSRLYLDIAKRYFKSKKFIKFFGYVIKSRSLLFAIQKFTKAYVSYRKSVRLNKKNTSKAKS